ncbi:MULTISPECIES: DUF6551 family protein [unclassified Mycobacterium]|uniref:DUF6551 family protein n=1 Tax=unclassified Mycobacterium TaxID=2642494 RepID=UPI0007FE0264|nr:MULTISPECIES: DUF6551 family protein [unclassified Mycobacterium]OBG58893.1 hypothetical protein A5703_03045 [Mycobacterium sp. E188]OBH37270.1 hypothetical protein A5691_26945 [Mycobacterium sp. E183]
MPRRYQYDVAPHKVVHGVMMDLDELHVDERAQRSLNELRAQKLSEGWINEAAGEIVVSDRGPDKKKHVIDGYHRSTAARMTGISKLPCEVHYGLSVADEAALFLLKNRESSKPNALDEYRIGLTAELPLFVDTEKVLIKHNLTVGKASSKNVVGAVQAILRITETSGPGTLDEVLRIAEAAWGRTAETWDGMLLGGLGLFLHRHGGEVNIGDLIQRMRRKEAWAWKQTVLSLASNQNRTQSGTGSRVTACYQELCRVYNKGRRNERTKISPAGRG